ncbi:nucleotide sugar dehydrogenase [Vallitalea maricola]|uniref:Nucleotide sugar dehydrogenase n=1 Tax=Vallitalea maricola TaxID=3074433 RepID=A0ACB5UJ83_9FIRM|nr:nucleotide sugar dehydrogenase [Vallitalea sp. AN17-2]
MFIKNYKIAVVGLGYVGLPIAVEFAKKTSVIGFDINCEKINQYKAGIDPTKEVGDEEIKKTTVEFTYEETKLSEANFIVVAVPTPVDMDKRPDLFPVTEVSRIIGRNLSRGAVVVYESTVYPGVTEDICIPILEEASGLTCGEDFKVGYSPERINPADKIHRLHNITKIVSGIDEETLEIVARTYETIIEAGVYRAKTIKVAEAAKLVENAQRDINIAFMNELAIVFDRMEIDTKDVIEAMNTKWNALGFYPGLVGGHCIGVDPYYFIYQAEQLGYHSQIILAGRKINDSMGRFIAETTVKHMIKANISVKNSKVYIMGITFKEDCPDIRNSKVEDIIKHLTEYEVNVTAVDPVISQKEVEAKFDIEMVTMKEINQADCIIFAVAHRQFKNLSYEKINKMFKSHQRQKKVIIDIKNILDKDKLENEGYSYWSL